MAEIEQRERNGAIVIDIPVDLEFDLWSKCCIQRVPKKLRKVNATAYTPQLLSIGPFHHGATKLLGMEPHKRRYADEFRKRTAKTEADLRRFVDVHHDEIRRSYAGTVEFRRDAFVEIVLVDACFVLELFFRNSETRNDDYMLNTPWLRRDLESDLGLFENQIPYAFLQRLHDFVIVAGATLVSSTEADENVPLLRSTVHPLSDHARRFFSCARHAEDYDTERVKHFTDLIRRALCPRKSDEAESDVISFLHSATRLETSGVSLVPRRNPRVSEVELAASPLDSVFISSCVPCVPTMRLEIPELVIDDETECLFRNCMALEQCVYPREARLCSYVLFLDQLVDTEDDVALLEQRKVVKNMLGSSEVVARLINRLCDQIVETGSGYYGIAERLNAYCDNCCNSTRATVKRTYFKDCWTASTAVFGFCVTAFSVTSIVRGLFFR